MTTLDCFIEARNRIHEQYGDWVSFMKRGEMLNKFGRNATVADAWETVAEWQGSVLNETLATGNTIDSIVSTSNSDIGKLIYTRGLVLNADNTTSLVTQVVTCAGQTPAPLATPLFRLDRMRDSTTGTIAAPPTPPVGTVYGYDSSAAGGVSGGAPVNAVATKCLIAVGETTSKKAALSIEGGTYWVIVELHVGVERVTGGTINVDLRLESRSFDGHWYPLNGSNISVRPGGNSFHAVSFEPTLIVPPNTDVRARAIGVAAGTAAVDVSIRGVLADVVPSSDAWSYPC